MAIRTESELYRRLQSAVDALGEGFTSGALYWQLNDIWPGASWSSIGKSHYWLSIIYISRISCKFGNMMFILRTKILCWK